MLHKNAVLFSEMSLVQALNYVRCGFELETQATEGKTSGESQVDEEATEEARSNWVSEVDFGELRDILSDRRIDTIETWLHEIACNDDNLVVMCNRTDPQEIEDEIGLNEIEVGLDGSVKGFEIRTRGPQTAMSFLRCARRVFSLDHEINERCSFHIHLSLPDVQHKYSQKFFASIVEFLASNTYRTPRSVVKRWLNDTVRNNYFSIIPAERSSPKMSFVHRHGQNSWEFRCFGNVQNARDAWTCLKLAVEALQFAYKVQLGKQQIVYGGDASIESWSDYILEQFRGANAHKARKTLSLTKNSAA